MLSKETVSLLINLIDQIRVSPSQKDAVEQMATAVRVKEELVAELEHLNKDADKEVSPPSV